MSKWVINSEHNEGRGLTSKDAVEVSKEHAYWERDYEENNYANIFSITESKTICKELTQGINDEVKEIIIPGCGSKTNLQKYIIDNFDNVESITCTDYSINAIRYAKSNYCHPKVNYCIEDTSKLSYQDSSFDYVIISNSILSNSDDLNRKMIRECYRVLKPKGKLYGFFPSIYCALDVAYLDVDFSHFVTTGLINLSKSTFFEKAQGIEQIFYTPLRLKQIFSEAKFIRKSIEVKFFDDDYFKEENERVYGFTKESGLCVWEFLVVLEKEC